MQNGASIHEKPSTKDVNPKRILVIEDNPSLRRDIVEMLGFEGYEVIDAENGKRGVERAHEANPDLIICDIMMPIMDGFEVLSTLRKDPQTAAIPFIFLTARVDRGDWRFGMASGADDYLTKPFTAIELLQAVATRLEKAATIKGVIDKTIETVRSNIITAMPHELRTPLNVILGFSTLMMMDAVSLENERVSEMSTHINTAANRLYRLVENYITYAYTELVLSDNKRHQIMKDGFLFHPKAPIEMYALERARVYSRDADLIFELEDTERLAIHEEYFKKIIEELVDNCCKFSAPGTPITVRAEALPTGYQLQFIDEGRGMTQAQIDQLGAYMQFERRLYEQQGSGLGLINSKRLTELHGGKMSITSKLNHGTVVNISLPYGSN